MDDGTISRILKKSRETGVLINVHAENPDLIDIWIGEFLEQGKTSPWYHYMSRPEFVEAEADKRAIHWAKNLNAPLYIVHLANKEGVVAVTEAKDQGYEVYAETCPHYLNFTSEVCKREDGRNLYVRLPTRGRKAGMPYGQPSGEEILIPWLPTIVLSRALKRIGAGTISLKFPTAVQELRICTPIC